MLKTLGSHVRGNVVDYVAPFDALGGTTYAGLERSRPDLRPPRVRIGAMKIRTRAKQIRPRPRSVLRAGAAMLVLLAFALPGSTLAASAPVAKAGQSIATAPADTLAASIDAGDYHNCGVQTDGTLACWGYNEFGQATPPAGTFTAVSAGGSHSCGLKTNGTLACWGLNTSGQATPPAGTFTAVSAGANHSCAIRGSSRLTCWGSNAYGKAFSLSGRFRTISAGLNHSCAMRVNGTGVCWGRNQSGQSTVPPWFG